MDVEDEFGVGCLWASHDDLKPPSKSNEEVPKKPAKSDPEEVLRLYFSDASSEFLNLQNWWYDPTVDIEPSQIKKEELRRRPDVINRLRPNHGKKNHQQPTPSQNKMLFDSQYQAMEDLNNQSPMSHEVSSVLDVCGAPGGFIQFFRLNTIATCRSIHLRGQRPCLTQESGHHSLCVYESESDLTEKAGETDKYDLVILSGWLQHSLDESLTLPTKNRKKAEKHQTLYIDSQGGITISSKILLLSQLLYGLASLSQNGRMIVLLAQKETLFIASLLRLLSASFQTMITHKPKIAYQGEEETCPWSLEDFRSGFLLVLTGYRPDDTLEPQLREAHAKLKEGKDLREVNVREESDLVDAYGPQLKQLYCPLWNVQSKALETLLETKKRTQRSENSRNFRMRNAGDTRGLLYHLLHEEKRPVRVVASSVQNSHPHSFLSRGKTSCYTKNEPYSWFCVDLGEESQFIATHYSFAYGAPGSACLPRYWILQGGHTEPDLQRKYDDNNLPENDSQWTNLAIHKNDRSIQAEWQAHSWRVQSRSSYRYFRLVQTGANTYPQHLDGGQWSHVFACNQFELYGTLLVRGVGRVNGPTVEPRRYEYSTPERPPDLIRGDLERYREMMEILEWMAQNSQGQVKQERVRVHDIQVE
ncbi:hypothetical protein PROFUN_04175 [Planoprotostelium fungivorum]|uniref:Ribosomal RNA methyltransferase FtsJ domain-containing protein n=1 Tax=Planoprotostelium fungivorum TaxID=1890364 RepID=A0A2P6NVU3_9EUKA|nr:hypothetical protein PROFUN_04175 [Planoprotostelium fungivorum]